MLHATSLAITDSLLVGSVTLQGISVSDSAIDLIGSGARPIGLALDGSQLQAGASIQLNNVDFAAILGAVNVHGGPTQMIFGGDSAAQGFTVGANGSQVFAGGGADQLSGYVLVSSKAAPEQVAKAVNLEALRFGDELVTLEFGSELTTLAGLYQDLLGPQADADGVSYWAAREQAGLSLGGVALELLTSSEGVAGFGALDGDAAHDVSLLYRAVFDRAADAGGLAFWTGHMENGMSLQEVADALLQSAEIVGRQLDAADWDFTV